MPSPEPKKVPGPKPADDGLDKIPMQKASPVWVVAGVVVVLVLGGLVGFSLFGGKRSTTAAALPNASLSAEPETNSQLDLKAQREHAAMTQRALAALEEKKKQEAASEPPAVASDQPEAEKPKATPKKSGGGPAPKADKLKDLGASIESQLK
jgi:hypothetical protein